MARKYAIVAALLAMVLMSCQSAPRDGAGTASTGSPEIPVKATVCQLATDPVAYNHKLVEVSGVVSHGFEEFSLGADHCNGPWLEFGGSLESGTVYCCVDKGREGPLVVEGVATTLVDDSKMKKLARLVKQSDYVISDSTTLVGRFFAGRRQAVGGKIMWAGYGHMGCCSLLVIQQVLD